MGLHCGIMADNSSIKLFILSLLLFSVWLWASLRRKIIFKDWCRTHDFPHNTQFHFENGIITCTTALKQFFICYLYWIIDLDSLQQRWNGPNNDVKYCGEDISQATIWLHLIGTRGYEDLWKLNPSCDPCHASDGLDTSVYPRELLMSLGINERHSCPHLCLACVTKMGCSFCCLLKKPTAINITFPHASKRWSGNGKKNL